MLIAGGCTSMYSASGQVSNPHWMPVYMRVHDHLGADDGAYRRPAGMIESGATIYVFVSAKANGIFGGSGPGFGACCPPRAGAPSSWMGATADARYLI
jgi:hypothetical protein